MKEIKFSLQDIGDCRLYLKGGELKLDAGCRKGLDLEWKKLSSEVSSYPNPARWSFWCGVAWAISMLKPHLTAYLQGKETVEPPVRLKIGQRWRWSANSKNFLHTLTPTGLISPKGTHPWDHSIKDGEDLKMAFCDVGGRGAPYFERWILVEDMP